jgi:uncharacterized protein YdhG (YjbR/CyaY superfamily)
VRSGPVAKSVDAYLKSAPAEVRPKLEQLRALFRSIAPKAEEGISYGMPYYKQDGALGGFALFKNHIGFFPGAIVKDFAIDLTAYKTSKGTIQLPLDKPLPAALIRKILKAGLKRNAAKVKKK